MRAYKDHLGVCQIVVKRIDQHFELPHQKHRHFALLRDPLFVEGLLEHILDIDEQGTPFIACTDCWQKYHELLAESRRELDNEM